MNDCYKNIENICNVDLLQENLATKAFFIGLYENMADMVEERVESFLCDECSFNDSGIRYKHSDEYKKIIKNRIVDDKNNKDRLKATMLWFVDMGAITKEDYEEFLRLKKLRNSYVHQMSNHVWCGLNENDANDLLSLFALYKKLDQWWINEIEMAIIDDEVDANYNKDGVASTAYLTFCMMFEALYKGKSKEYIEMLHKVAKGKAENENEASI